ncbi:MAG: L-histidine N(alpha)-methyltransferase, partial [Steroidobacteraceae bacterium]
MTPRLAAAVPARDADFADELAADLRSSLAEKPRKIPSRYLYDSLGSALFDAICELP